MTTDNPTQPPSLLISEETWDALFQAALQVQQRAYAPYSQFQVGAALLTESGEIVVGCNVENATYGATVCAERTAFVNAVAQGHRNFRALCVVTHLEQPAAPCGICRQIIAEFCDQLPIMMANPNKNVFMTNLDELLPYRFSRKDLQP